MNDALRELLYPLGFLSSLAFGGRALLQWLSSEAKQKSHVTKSFWRLSLAGNLFLALHACIQVQYHVCLVQACSAVISWRNLDLMQPKENQKSLQSVLRLFALAALFTTALFYLSDEPSWFRMPLSSLFGEEKSQVPYFWHLAGFAGIGLFSSRFWVQWWLAERHKKSSLGRPFWWISLTGALLSLLYFSRIRDPVNLIGPLVGTVPYIRNLMLLRKSSGEAA